MSDSDAVSQNRAYWNRLAPHRLGESVKFFLDGGSALTAAELEAVGDLRGRRVLQLACSVGDEALTFARHGALVTGVDLAAAHLATGQAKAEALGVDVIFIEQDMMTLDAEITAFDVVYTSWGGLCWAPSITAWARLAADRLVPGGLLVISEHHPLWEILTVQAEGAVSVSGDYFNPGRDGYPDPAKAPEVTRQLDAPTAPHRSFVWNLGSVVSAVLDAGLIVRSLREFADPEMYVGCGRAAAHLPATYVLTARRPL